MSTLCQQRLSLRHKLILELYFTNCVYKLQETSFQRFPELINNDGNINLYMLVLGIKIETEKMTLSLGSYPGVITPHDFYKSKTRDALKVKC